jgi:hypothetical protein
LAAFTPRAGTNILSKTGWANGRHRPGDYFVRWLRAGSNISVKQAMTTRIFGMHFFVHWPESYLHSGFLRKPGEDKIYDSINRLLLISSISTRRTKRLRNKSLTIPSAKYPQHLRLTVTAPFLLMSLRTGSGVLAHFRQRQPDC